MDELRFDLELELTKAEKNFKSFIQRSEAELKKLEQGVEKAMSSPRSRTNATKDAERQRRQQEQTRKHNEREQDKIDRYNQRMADKAGKERMRAADRVVAQEKRNADQIAKAYESAYRRIERAGRRLNKPALARDNLNDLGRMLGPGANPDAIRSHGIRAAEDIRDDAARDRKAQQEVRAEQKKADAIAAARMRAASRIDNAETLSAETRANLHRQLADDLTQIESRRAGKTKEILNSELIAAQQASARRVRVARQAAAQSERDSMAEVTKTNKRNMMMFQVQQAVEDYSFAGIRGASNNIAMMASQMGGSTGLAAMGMLTAGALTVITTELLGMNNALTVGGSSLQTFEARLKSVRDIKRQSLEQISGADMRRGQDAFQDDARQARREAEIAHSSFTDVAERERKLLEVEKKQKALQSYMPESRESYQKKIEEFNKAARDAGLDAQLSPDTWMVAGDAIEGFSEALEEAKQNTIEASAEWQKLQEKAEVFEMIAEAAGKMKDEIEQSREASERLAGIETRTTAFGADDAVAERKRLEDKALQKEIKNTSEAMGLPYYENKLKDQQTDLGLALDNGDQEQANQILKEIEQTLGRIANIQTIIADLGEEWAKSHSEILIKLSEAVDKENEARNAIQGQIELTQQRIALESEKLEMLEMQKRVSRESFEADKFGGEMTLVKRHADERQKTVLKHAEREQKEIERQAKEAKERVDQIVNANPGNESVKAWGDAYKDAIDRREERLQSRLERRTDRNVKRIERERQAKEREMLDKRETDLQGRAGAEGRKADAALGAGEFAKAEEWRKKQRGTLEELQRLQMGQVNDRPLPEAEAALRRAESTQGDIDSTFDAEMVAAQQAKAKEQAYLLELQTALRELDAIKAQLADKTVVSAMDLAAADAMIAKLQTMLALKNDIADAQTAGDSVAGAAGVPGRASGGPVLAGQPYMTGEFGRELFVPSASGRIFNASDTRGMMSQVAAAIQAGDHGGRQPVTAGGSTTNFGTVNVHTMGSQTLDGLMASAATASKNARIRRS